MMDMTPIPPTTGPSNWRKAQIRDPHCTRDNTLLLSRPSANPDALFFRFTRRSGGPEPGLGETIAPISATLARKSNNKHSPFSSPQTAVPISSPLTIYTPSADLQFPWKGARMYHGSRADVSATARRTELQRLIGECPPASPLVKRVINASF